MISDQIDYVQSKSLGFNRDQLVSLSLDSISRTRLETIENTFARESNVSGTAASIQLPTNITHQTALSLKNETDGERRLMTAVSVNSDFMKTVGLQLIAGRDFTHRIEQTSETWEIILNESAAAFFGWTAEQALGKEMIVWQKEGKVTGVVKDFHFSSLHKPISPLVIFSGKGATQYTNFIVKASGSPSEIREAFEKLWKQAAPDSPFLLTFLDDQYESLYKKESLLKQVINLFAVLAIVISNLGLFGLASYLIMQRTKEMGIRKVLGASPTTLIKLVSGSFVQLVLVAFLLAIPLSWYLMSEWLSGFAYHISFNWMIVMIAGASVLILALATVVYHALQVTRINPATTLRAQ